MSDEEVITARNFKVSEVAKLLRVQPQTIRERIKNGEFEGAFKDRKQWLIPHAAVQQAVQRRYGDV